MNTCRQRWHMQRAFHTLETVPQMFSITAILGNKVVPIRERSEGESEFLKFGVFMLLVVLRTNSKAPQLYNNNNNNNSFYFALSVLL